MLPVFLFALSQCESIQKTHAILLFFILHFLVYPASNGYNSYMDRDESPIGGLEKPLQPTVELFRLTIAMDLASVILAWLISPSVSLGIMLYILASRAYSWRKIRLKKYPLIGFLTVFIFQGGWIFFITCVAASPEVLPSYIWTGCLVSSLLIGALYPLTQIYQHKEDREDGVRTISMVLGIRGSFIFSVCLFMMANLLMYYLLHIEKLDAMFSVYLGCMLPVVSFFLFWMWKAWKNIGEANFSNSFRMNLISTICTNLFFIILIIETH